MSIDTNADWQSVENLARAHEAALNKLGFPLVHITVEDRLRGAITSAMTALKAGQNLVAYQQLERALDL